MDKRTSIVLATGNQHKIKEIKEILQLDIDYQTLDDYGAVEIREAGQTLLENSLVKASFTYKLAQKPALADDSGLFVEALNNAPGVFSSRYGHDDKDRIQRLLKNLEQRKDRKAFFKSVFVYYYAQGKYEIFDGTCSGMIAFEPRGVDGFGYDPVFIPHGYKKTFAELGKKVKNRISHRAQALAKFKVYIKKSDSYLTGNQQ